MEDNPLFKQNMGHWIKRLDHAMTNRINEVLRTCDLARSQWQVLFQIQRSGCITQKELQDMMRVESGTLTGIVDSLVRKGWVIRREHPKDRRMKVLSLTEDGKNRWKETPDPIRVLRPQMMHGISAEDEEIVVRILERAVSNLESNSSDRREF